MMPRWGQVGRVLAIGLAAAAGLMPPYALAKVERTFWVSTDGSDKNPGTKAAPFASLEGARDAVRQAKGTTPGDIEVILAGGTYRLERPWALDARDGGRGQQRILYRSADGQAAVVSGGKRVVGWRADTEGRWKAVSPVADFRQLYVQGRRATRARGGALADGKRLGVEGYQTSAAAMADWHNQADIELCYEVVWCHTRLKVARIERRNGRALVTMLAPHFDRAIEKEGVQIDMPTWIENALELLDEAGEWYLDRAAGTVYYRPRPGEDLTRIEVVVPAVEKLVELRGTLDDPVRNIRFEGITFADAGWSEPGREGLVDIQANFRINPEKLLKRDNHLAAIHNEYLKSPANVVCHAAQGIQFERCTFTRLGAAGLDLEYGCQDVLVSGCHFHDISGSAIQVGDVLADDHHPKDPRRIMRGNRISNCLIHDVACEYEGGVGVFAGYTEGTEIAHNEICRLPYSGISVGWGWGEEDAGGGNPSYHQPFRYDTPTPAGKNRIEKNHIHHVMQRLADGGGIYTLGNQPGTVIRGNHLHDNPGSPGGIYLDEGSGFIEVTGNVVYRVPTAMNFNNHAQDRIKTCPVHDNQFDVVPGEGQRQTAGLEAAYADLLARLRE